MNIKLKKLFLFVLLQFFIFSNLFAQVSEDPSHKFYKSAQKWNVEGIITNVPPLRPYPLNVIKNILLQVMDNGSENEKIEAEEYWQEITGKPFYLYIDAMVNTSNDNFGVSLFGAAQGDINLLNDFVSVGYNLGFNGYTKEAKEYFSAFNPKYSGVPYDTVQDPAEAGPLSGYLNANESIAIGNTKYYFQMGINRLGYGDFIDQGIALNESSYHSANMIFTLLNDRWNFTQLYSSIGATKAYNGNGLRNDKYLTFHQLEFNLTPKITLAYYESIVFGKRFDFSYIIPAPYMAIQGLGGCNDNLQMGIRFNYKPITNLLWANDIYVDDVSFNDLVKFDFDTKIRISATTGLLYYFDNPYFDTLKFNYTLVTPYTYSHWDFSDPSIDLIDNKTYSYQNYTNNGIPIGSLIPPNSDVIKLAFNYKPFPKLTFNFDVGFIRHGNSAETLPVDEAMTYVLYDKNVYATDGSIFHHVFYPIRDDPDNNSNYLDSAWDTLNFLNQDHKMYVFQGGISADYEISTGRFGKFNLKLGYKAEYIKNKGVDSNLFPGGLVTENEDGSYIYNNVTYETAEEVIYQFKENWYSTFEDVFNNYLYIGFEWRF